MLPTLPYSLLAGDFVFYFTKTIKAIRSELFQIQLHSYKHLSAGSHRCLFLSALTVIPRRDDSWNHVTFPLSLLQEKMPDLNRTKMNISCSAQPSIISSFGGIISPFLFGSVKVANLIIQSQTRRR